MFNKLAKRNYLEFANPDIAIGDRVAVVLQADGQLGGVCIVLGRSDIFSCSQDLHMILNQYAILNDGDICG